MNELEKANWEELGTLTDTQAVDTSLEKLTPWQEHEIRLGIIKNNFGPSSFKNEVKITIRLSQGVISNRIALWITPYGEPHLIKIARILKYDKVDDEVEITELITTLPIDMIRKIIKVYYVWNANNVRSYCHHLHSVIRKRLVNDYPVYYFDSDLRKLFSCKIRTDCDLCTSSFSYKAVSWEPLPTGVILFLHDFISKYKSD